jgi:hypothetical protein
MVFRIYKVIASIKVNRMRNSFSTPRDINNENLTGCLQRYVVLGSEMKQKDSFCTTNKTVLCLISSKHSSDFPQINQDIHISIFSNYMIIEFIHFNHVWNVYHSTGLREFRRKWLAHRINKSAMPIYEIIVKIMGRGTSNPLSKPRESIINNLTECLQRYIVFGYERHRKHINFKIHERVLQIIPNEDNCDFLQRNGDSHISTFLKNRTFEFVQFDYGFGTTITHKAFKNLESGKNHW